MCFNIVLAFWILFSIVKSHFYKLSRSYIPDLIWYGAEVLDHDPVARPYYESLSDTQS